MGNDNNNNTENVIATLCLQLGANVSSQSKYKEVTNISFSFTNSNNVHNNNDSYSEMYVFNSLIDRDSINRLASTITSTKDLPQVLHIHMRIFVYMQYICFIYHACIF